MKLYFQETTTPWQPERYRYSAEQMMLTLFPGERPEYPADLPRTLEGEPSAALFALEAEGDTAVLTAQVAWEGKTAQGQRTFPAAALNEDPHAVYHVVQHALKLAFYQAGTALLGHEPPWGALTGVRPVKLPTRAMKEGASPEEARKELEEEYRVSPRRAQLALDCAKASLAAEQVLGTGTVSVYVGVPFCPTRCAYCSFVSADVGRTMKLLEPYVESLLKEIEATGKALREVGLTVRTLYMGGGTPTTLSAGQMDRVLSACEADLPLEGCVEFTVEAGRPDTITREKLEVLRAHGIGRISINPQTLEDEVLRAIGRRHTAEDIRAAYVLAREVGFDSINMDLIAGLPRDSYEGFRRTLDGVLAMAPENITVHTLALKKGSRLMNGAPNKGKALVGERTRGDMSELSCKQESEGYKAHEDAEKGGALPSGEETARMLEYSLDALGGAGFRPYYLYRQKYMSGSLENVGWTLPGKESIYNIAMMEELHTVVSIGGGGVTKLVDPAKGQIVRLPNPKYPQDYLTSLDKVLAQKEELVRFYAGARPR